MMDLNLGTRSPERMVDKAIVNNYRQGPLEKCCCFCVLKLAVPDRWCDMVGRQVELGKVCDRYKGA